MSEGHSNKWIALTMNLAESTVSTYLQRAMRKLGTTSRVELVARVRGSITTPDGFSCKAVARGLTEAEIDVTQRILCGQSNELISAARGTSVRTVANQVASIFRKFGVASRSELASLMVTCRHSLKSQRSRAAQEETSPVAGEPRVLLLEPAAQSTGGDGG